MFVVGGFVVLCFTRVDVLKAPMFHFDYLVIIQIKNIRASIIKNYTQQRSRKQQNQQQSHTILLTHIGAHSQSGKYTTTTQTLILLYLPIKQTLSFIQFTFFSSSTGSNPLKRHVTEKIGNSHKKHQAKATAHLMGQWQTSKHQSLSFLYTRTQLKGGHLFYSSSALIEHGRRNFR